MPKPKLKLGPLRITPVQRRAQKFVLIKGQRVPIKQYLKMQRLNAVKTSGKNAVRS
jgi:hypothetical protein